MVAILYKRGGPRYYFQNSLLTMGRGKDLTEEEKRTIIKEIATGNGPGAIAKEIGRHVGTVKQFVRSPSKRKPRCDRGVLKAVTKHDFWRLRRSIRKMPGATSAKIFEEAGLVNVLKTTCNNLLRKVAAIKSPSTKPPLTPRHRHLRMEWSKKYMKTDMDESRVTLDGPDGWAKGWVYNGETCHTRMRHQQGGGEGL